QAARQCRERRSKVEIESIGSSETPITRERLNVLRGACSVRTPTAITHAYTQHAPRTTHHAPRATPHDCLRPTPHKRLVERAQRDLPGGWFRVYPSQERAGPSQVHDLGVCHFGDFFGVLPDLPFFSTSGDEIL